MPDALEELSNMMGFPHPYGDVPPLPADFDFDASLPTGQVVPIAGDSHPEPDDVGMFGADGSYVGSYGSVQPEPPPPAPSGGDDVVPIAGDSSAPESGNSIYQNIGDLTAPQPPPGSDSIYQAVDVGTGCASWTVRVASVNGTVIHAAGNPNLENGATHKC